MTINYRPSELEKRIFTFYLKKGVWVPEDIKETLISDLFGIILTYSDKRSFAVEEENFKMININNQIDEKQQREHFFHELCHIVRHFGAQPVMPQSFMELQEIDSKRFTKYAALPYHMIMQYDFKNPHLIHNLSDDFKVTEELCWRRIEDIRRKQTDAFLVPEKTLTYN